MDRFAGPLCGPALWPAAWCPYVEACASFDWQRWSACEAVQAHLGSPFDPSLVPPSSTAPASRAVDESSRPKPVSKRMKLAELVDSTEDAVVNQIERLAEV